MNLDHPDAQADNLLHICQNIGCVPGMDAAAGNQAPGIFFNVVGHEAIHFRREAHDLRSNIVDEYGAVDTNCIKVLQEGLGRTTELNHLVEVNFEDFPALIDAECRPLSRPAPPDSTPTILTSGSFRNG